MKRSEAARRYDADLRGPLLVLAYFEPDDAPKLIRAIKATRTPPGTRIYVGSYGVNAPVSRQIQALTRGRYAPLFPIKPTSFWNRRQVQDADEPQYAGKLPSLAAMLALPGRERLAWGRELGRRFRDGVRQAEAEGVRVDAWQLDELVAELSGGQGRQWREFTRGVLHGLNFGRSEFGDGPRIGFVWASRRGLHIARLRSKCRAARVLARAGERRVRTRRRGVSALQRQPGGCGAELRHGAA